MSEREGLEDSLRRSTAGACVQLRCRMLGSPSAADDAVREVVPVGRHQCGCDRMPRSLGYAAATGVKSLGRVRLDAHTTAYAHDRRRWLPCRALVERILGPAAVGVVLLAACGGDDDVTANGDNRSGARDGQTHEYVEAVSAAMRENEDGLSLGQAECIGTAVVDEVGVDALTDADVSPAELGDADDLASLGLDVSEDTVDRLGTALSECDLAGLFENQVVDSFIREVGAEAPPDAVACLSDNLDGQDLVDALARNLVDGDARRHTGDPIVLAAAECPSVMTAVLLAQVPAELRPSVEACLDEFVEANADLVGRSFSSVPSDARQEWETELAAACPRAAAALGG